MDRSAERSLVRRIRSGERDACAEFVRRHHAAVFRLLLHLSRDSHAAEDLTQETFAAAWSSIGSFRGSASLATWLHRIAYCKYADRQRRGRRPEAQIDARSLVADLSEKRSSPARGPLDDLLADEQSRRLALAVDALDEADRELVVLHYLQGLSFREMAEVLGRPAGTVKWRVSEVLARLRELIDAQAKNGTRDGVAGRAGSAAAGACEAGRAGGA